MTALLERISVADERAWINAEESAALREDRARYRAAAPRFVPATTVPYDDCWGFA